ncbi:DUF86 domain-containing protein [Candidatus Parcubacteria bacterium]|nr:DUF86 domain-containing protein [Candidatus Parcubacteria bacterium]
MTRRPEKLFLFDIVKACENIELFIGDETFENFQEDSKTIHAVVRCIEIIGEAANNISEEVKDRYSEIEWKQVVGMRNLMIHEYFGVDSDIIWQTSKEDIPVLLEKIKNILNDLEKNNNECGNGFALIGTLIAVIIIAAIFFGSYYFSKDKDKENEIVTPQGQIKALNKAKSDIDKVNQITKERDVDLEETIQ